MSNWATPTENDGKNNAAPSQFTKGNGGRNLNVQIEEWRRDAKLGDTRSDRCENRLSGGGACGRKAGKQENVETQVRKTMADPHSESLNPDWEEILMGWPVGWTDPTKPCEGIFPGFPMGQGYDQFNYEPPRTLPRSQMTGRTARIKMIGNGVVPQCAASAFVRLLSELLNS